MGGTTRQSERVSGPVSASPSSIIIDGLLRAVSLCPDNPSVFYQQTHTLTYQ